MGFTLFYYSQKEGVSYVPEDWNEYEYYCSKYKKD